MTAPLNPILWATLKVQTEGFSFAVVSKTNGKVAQSGTKLLLPPGVNQIQVDWMGQSRVAVQAGVNGLTQRVELPAAKTGTRRSAFFRVPVDAVDAFVNVTTYENHTSEVDQVMGGIQVVSSNIT